MRLRLIVPALLAVAGLAFALAALRPEVGAAPASSPGAGRADATSADVSLAAPDASPDEAQPGAEVSEREVVDAREADRDAVGFSRSATPRRERSRAVPPKPAVVPVKVVDTSGNPLLGARVFYKQPGSRKPWRRAAPVDEDAVLEDWVERELPAERELRVLAVFLAGPVGRAELDLAPQLSGVNPGLVITVATEELRRFHGRVFAADTGEPVAGARTTVRADFNRSTRWVLGRWRVLARGRSGADGRFELELPPWDGLKLEVTADGYRGAFVEVPERGHDTLRFEKLIELERSAQVMARVVGTDGDPIPGITVRFSSDRAELPLAGEDDPLEWTSVTDAEGVAYLDGVPTGVYLDVECLRLEQRLLHQGDGLYLHPGEARNLELALP